MDLSNQKRYKNDIMVFENFLTKDECNAILNYWNTSADNGNFMWQPISFYESYASNLPEDPRMLEFGLPSDFFKQLEIKMKEATEITRGDKVKKVSYHAQKWIPGAFAGFHSDNSTDGKYNAFERSKWAAFVYLNDDFDGGELEFRDDPIKIKPKAGMLAAFAGGAHNEHQVRVVDNGIRYTIGSFWDNYEAEYSEEKKAQWEKDISEARKQQAEQQQEWAKLREKGERLKPGPQ